MAKKEEMRELLRQEIEPLKLEIGQISRSIEDLKTTVSFLSEKYDSLLGQYNRVAEKLSHQSTIIEGLKNDIQESRKIAYDAAKQAEDLAQYIRRDCLEISGIPPNDELSCVELCQTHVNLITLPLQWRSLSGSLLRIFYFIATRLWPTSAYTGWHHTILLVNFVIVPQSMVVIPAIVTSYRFLCTLQRLDKDHSSLEAQKFGTH